MKKLVGIASAIALVTLGMQTATAGAATATIGQIAPGLTTNGTSCGSCGFFQFSTFTADPSYAVPALPPAATGPWTLESWRSRGASDADTTAALTVWRPTGTVGQFELVFQGNQEAIPMGTSPDHAASVAVEPGDVLGVVSGLSGFTTIYLTGSFDSQIAGASSAMVGQTAGVNGTGSDVLVSPTGGSLVNVEATLSAPEPTPPQTGGGTNTTPPVQTTPVPPVKPKKCKRKKPKKASAAKKKKCKKKGARK